MKRCRICGRNKVLGAYHIRNSRTGCRRTECKKCWYKAVRANVLKSPERNREYQRNWAKTPKGRVCAGKSARNFDRNHPEKRRAYAIVQNALKTGRLTKEPCVYCKSKRVEAHHTDYSKPLEVKWVCFPCHRKYEHGQLAA